MSSRIAARSGTTYGRPVRHGFDRTGALLVADDTGSMIWRVTATAEQSAAFTTTKKRASGPKEAKTPLSLIEWKGHERIGLDRR